MANFTFDATQVVPSNSFEAIPAGTYAVRITESERKENAKKNGEYLKLTFTVVEGPYKGRLLWAYLNIIHDNATAQEIARRDLSAICHACGKLQLKDTQQLHNITMEIVVRVVEDDYGKKNEITGYKKRERTIAAAEKPKAKKVAHAEAPEEEEEDASDDTADDNDDEDEDAPWDN
ncbi:MAG TPA: DUF669 domain-containing protein [Anaerolineaceae bacterium]|nr:DUF669 domain-containing protein [Anaerolineaceae bacterium]